MRRAKRSPESVTLFMRRDGGLRRNLGIRVFLKNWKRLVGECSLGSRVGGREEIYLINFYAIVGAKAPMDCVVVNCVKE